MTTSYEGTVKVVTFEVRDPISDVLVDPSGAVTITYGRVGGEPHTTKTYGADPEVLHPATGTFRILVECPDDGSWGARIETDGDYRGAHDVYWNVTDSKIKD